MHSVLERQLRNAGAAPDAPPDRERWASLLDAVSRAYVQADQDRYLLERSLALSSEEMQELHGAVRAERDAIESVTCSLGEGVCAVDESGVVQFINPEGVRLLGLANASDVMGRCLPDVARARDERGRTLSEILSDGSLGDGEQERLIIADDVSTFVVYQLRALIGQRAGLVLTLRDISERHRHDREREEMQRQLVDVSRRAGMAEVASGVLHNVGNVLNSVSVSASMATDRLARTSLGGLERAADLLQQHADDLPRFVTENPAGRRLPEYVAALTEALGEDHMAVDRELRELRQSVAHINEVVRAQLSLTRLSGITEPHDMPSLIEEALRLVQIGLDRHHIAIVREFTPAPPVMVQRHEALQILVNLFTNAKQAMSGMTGDARKLTLRTAPSDDGAGVCVQVRDTGVGIEPDAMGKIFSHGFTTRKDGHGFGLHFSALSAKSMGGSLRASSGGRGQGATFTLMFPAHIPKEVAA